MLRTQFCDTLSFRPTDDESISLELSNATHPAQSGSFPLDESNLIVKAAIALRQYADCHLGACITAHKRIPAEAGLAGGSSNAATTLLALNQLWELNLSISELHEIAATLGSDLNFFLADCRSAICRGRGEIVEPIPMGGLFHFVVVRPQTGNSTPEVFARLDPSRDKKSCQQVVEAIHAGSAAALSRHAFNRLTPAAEESNSEMSFLLQELELRTGRPAFMSGSGSACYLIARNFRDARRLSNLVQSTDYQVDGIFRV